MVEVSALENLMVYHLRLGEGQKIDGNEQNKLDTTFNAHLNATNGVENGKANSLCFCNLVFLHGV